MNARSIARQFALWVLFQWHPATGMAALEKASVQELVLNTTRTLTQLAQEQLDAAFQPLNTLYNTLAEVENDHPDNADVPWDQPTRPVALPNTQVIREQLDATLMALENLQEALYMPEINAHARKEDVINYALMLVRTVDKHVGEIDGLINQYAEDWTVDRMQKMDRALLRLAVAELKFTKQVDVGTGIDEALNLTKRYATDESRKFINGILSAMMAEPEEAAETGASTHV